MKEKLKGLLSALSGLSEAISTAKTAISDKEGVMSELEEVKKDSQKEQIAADKAAVGSKASDMEDEKKEEEGEKEDVKGDESKAAEGTKVNPDEYVKEHDKVEESKVAEDAKEDSKEDKVEDKKEGETKEDEKKEDKNGEDSKEDKEDESQASDDSDEDDKDGDKDKAEAACSKGDAEDGQVALTEEDPRSDEKYDQDELKMGVDLEKEHTSDEKVARKMVKDHLDENPKYYSEFKKFEAESEAACKPASASVASKLGLSESEAAIITKYSHKDLASMFVSLSSELTKNRAEKEAVEKSVAAETRFNELVQLGVAFKGEKQKAQKDKISEMDEKSFAAYKGELMEVKEMMKEGEGFDKDEMNKARSTASSLAVELKLEQTDRVKLFTSIK
jgi:hypothetical protein